MPGFLPPSQSGYQVLAVRRIEICGLCFNSKSYERKEPVSTREET